MRRDTTLDSAIALFETQFGRKPEIAAYSPGRVNLIGEHTDYNCGFVLPFALPYKTYVVGSRNTSGMGEVFTSNSKESAKFKIDKDLTPGEPSWANYVKGTVFQYMDKLPAGFGFEAVIVTTVPIGSGLSSSAALEVATATLLEGLCSAEFKVDIVDKALRCQKAEHTFANMPCGIMDQYISAMGARNKLLLIDCRTNKAELVAFGAEGTTADKPVIVVTNSKVKHQLTGSEYPERVHQCQQAVAILKKKFLYVHSLRDATLEMLEEVKKDMTTKVFNRAKHVISENQRTLVAVEALKKSDYATVGQCMTESHVSLREDYQVSCEEIDYLVDLALQVPGVLGSRITGGGFGGCTVSLVEKESVLTFQQFVRDNYRKQTKTTCEFYVTEPSEGSGYLRVADLEAPVESTAQSQSSSLQDLLLPTTVIGILVALGLQCFRGVE